jgi:hypothetical protein
MSNKPKIFQYHLAIFGGLFFAISFQISEYLQSIHQLYFAQIFLGYSLGFMLSFGLLVILELFRGNTYKFIDNNPVFKPLSYLCLFIIIGISAVGFWSTNYTTISYAYNTAFGLGTVISAFGLVPVISYNDS